MARSRNFSASCVLIAVTAGADTEFAVEHGLQRLDGTPLQPRGMIVIRRNQAATLYDSGTPWTETTAYLKSSVSGATFYVLFFE